MNMDMAVILMVCAFIFNLSEGLEVCYSLIRGAGNTCFSNDPPFDNALRFLPDAPEIIGTQFFLHTRNGEIEQIYSHALLNSANLRRRQTKFLIHGYTGGPINMVDMVNALLGQGDYNVISVDWRGGAQRLNYYQSVADARLVGVQIGDLIYSLSRVHQISPAAVHIIGISLGAQVASYAGKTVPGLGRISALDPAGPGFYRNDRRIRTSPSDAQFVDVIHTNGGTSLADGFGLLDGVGHADFYVNGGKDQPGCTSNTCSHIRAWTFYIETVKQSCPFLSYPCGPGLICQDTCSGRGCSRAGYFSLQSGASGLYYIATSESPPFCSVPSVSSNNRQSMRVQSNTPRTRRISFRARPRSRLQRLLD